MEIIIIKTNSGPSNAYDVWMEEKIVHKALVKKALRSWLAKIEVSGIGIDNEKITIKRKLRWYGSSYYRIDRNSPGLLFKPKSALKRHYYCIAEQDRYDVYAHENKQCSVYRNGKQVARFESVGSEKITILADSAVDPKLLIYFCLIYEAGGYNKILSLKGTAEIKDIEFELPAIKFQGKKINKDWKPQ
jgi:hypothetical protein